MYNKCAHSSSPSPRFAPRSGGGLMHCMLQSPHSIHTFVFSGPCAEAGCVQTGNEATTASATLEESPSFLFKRERVPTGGHCQSSRWGTAPTSRPSWGTSPVSRRRPPLPTSWQPSRERTWGRALLATSLSPNSQKAESYLANLKGQVTIESGFCNHRKFH